LSYTVWFENDPDFATAPAQEVRIKVPISPKADPYSLRVGNFGFGDFVFSVPPNSAFYNKRLDVTDSLGIYLDVIAGIDVINNEAFWIFQSIDPLTGLPPNDPQTGFLPVNDSISHKGEGFVTFNYQPKSSDQTGDSISAQAQITFDINEPINTNIWKNVVDAHAPSSSILPIPSSIGTANFSVSFTGEDDIVGSGISKFSLYYSKDNGDYNLFGEYSINDSATFIGKENSTYGFFSIAKDNVGNTEPMKTLPDVTTTISGTGLMASIKIFMEGAFEGTAGSMSTNLNNNGLIPLSQPYNSLPWNYTGYEQTSSIPTGVVDWILLELRDAPSPQSATSSTKLPGWPKAMFLKSDGSIVDLTGHKPNIGMPTVSHNLYVVIRHRNHIEVMSSGGLSLSGSEYVYDFTTGIDKAYGGSAGYKQIDESPPTFGMVAADIDADGSVFISDFNHWATDFGNSNGYFRSDCDMDGNVFVSDFNRWGMNFGSINIGNSIMPVPKYSSTVPK
jgi:hypothetical protein